MNTHALSCMHCLSADLGYNAVSEATTISELLALDMFKCVLAAYFACKPQQLLQKLFWVRQICASAGLLRRPAFGTSMAPVCGPSRTQRSTWASGRCTAQSPFAAAEHAL